MINLLPDDYKQELIKIEKEKVQTIILALLNFFFVFLLLAFISLNIYFNFQLQSKKIFIESLSHFQESPEIKEQVEKTNEQLKNINKFYHEKIHYSLVLNKIFQTIPETAYLNTLSFAGNKVSLAGFIASRDDLLIFKENLEEKFKQVDFPPINWAERENINFFVTFFYEK